ncbi:hypothetical protein Poli38472_012587 [Pythium oligandrum]|uniref:Uncharacterized protein n=1 Tax=Pythium oligandrum TaxID=41045 RepID=A0A8K1FG92_PYTOL|nr:hypothetical protein Poli38472_012587 [Pythium oligandrum]|eukprot:TMW61396.1 hypothetical protein Poli38472_012587 [Pythium oligandrum]
MARHLPPFGTLKLTREEELAVKQQASAVIQRTLALEIEYRRQGAQVDAKEWKKVSSVDDFYVYKQRRPAHRRPNPPARRETACTEDIAAPELFSVREDSTKQWRESVESLSECSLARSSSSLSGSSGDEPRVPEILCTGSLEGRLEDFMFGVYDGDDDSWRVRAAYIKDKLEDARILATLERPTQDDPFRFLGIKWFSIEYPPLVGAFIQKRETLVIESMGVASDDQGGQYGYYMMDNFVHSNLPERSEYGMVRNKFKLCFIHRQITPDRIGDKCIVERKLIVDMHASQLTPRALPFCFACVLRAKQLSSADLMLTSDIKKQ